MAVVGAGGKGVGEYRSNVAGAGSYLQGSFSYGSALWEKYMDVDGVCVKSTRGFSSSGIQKDCRDDGSAYDRWRVIMDPSG